MQTFLPFAHLHRTAQCLDWRRLGKQRVEAWQIYNIITGKQASMGWVNHPAVKMWRKFPDFLAEYYNAIVYEWTSRGYNNSMKPLPTVLRPTQPDWFGEERFHTSHQSNLLRKDPEYYKGFFDPKLADDLPYYWPGEK